MPVFRRSTARPILTLCLSLSLFSCSNIYQHQNDEFALNHQAKVKQEVFDASLLSSLFVDEHFEYPGSLRENIFALSDAHVKHFNAYFNDPLRAHIPEHKRFSAYIEESLAGFSYKGETFNAQEAFEQSSGNCLSLAIVTTALLHHIDLDFHYQRVDSRPIYSKHDNILLMSSHVVTRVFEPKPEVEKGSIYFGRNSVTIDYFPTPGNIRGHGISKADLVSLYYQNKAAAALVEKDLDMAYGLTKEALKQSHTNAEALNLLGVIYKQKGLNDHAAKVFETMLTFRLSSINTLENYAQLLKNEGKYAQAEAIETQIEQVNDENPYRWISLADSYLERGRNRLAIKFANKAYEMAPYLHEPHFIRSKAYAAMSKPGASVDALKVAIDLSNSQTERSEYIRKLSSLKRAYFPDMSD